MGRKKKKNKDNPYILEHMTDEDQRIGSLVDQGVSVKVDNKQIRQDVDISDPREVYKRITHMNIMPGSGEYLYSTDVVTREYAYNYTQELNHHSDTSDKADALYALDDMIATYPNLKGLNLIFSWYGDVKSDQATIQPRQSQQGDVVAFSELWNVGSYTRETALYSNHNKATPGDVSLTSFIDACNERGIEVTLYPFLSFDIANVGWRGSLPFDGTIESLNNFEQQYSNFIRHYSQLFGGTNKIHRMIIGSELRSLTQLVIDGEYEGVNVLKRLAANVKADFGSDDTLISYTATSYDYHSHNGNYNMDALWSDPNIDDIGVSNYLPITDYQDPSTITYQDMLNGFESGEGWDHTYPVYNSPDNKVAINPPGEGVEARKNIFGWWNENRSSTGWTSRMKPLYFSEYGFASVSGTTNQPNVFAPSLPRLSTGEADNEALRDGISAFNEYWDKKTQGIEDFAYERAIWTADLRPYPEFPNKTNVWGDGSYYDKGHWIHGKLK
tara:strand:- start:784 stop:2280 length:1497 start_codon:yes stop_codon:yes gene_type:complete